MIGYIRILKNQISNEMQINRHIKPSRDLEDGAHLIDPIIVSRKIKGLKRNSWIVLSILFASVYWQTAHDFWMSKIMLSIISILLLLNLYTNSHNIHNHQRWLSGNQLIDKSDYFKIFKKKPLLFTLNAFISHQGDRE